MAAPAPVSDESHPLPAEAPPEKPKYKSYKKKYLKIRHAFSHKMRESNALFDEEQRAIKLTRRLQEQNDQLLEMLLSINDSTKTPPHLRYNLDPTPPESEVPALSPDQEPDSDPDITQAHLALEEAKSELHSQSIDLPTYKTLESSLLSIINLPKSLSRLSKISHSVLHGPNAIPLESLPADLTEESPANYLSPTHEDDYCTALDHYLDTAKPDAPPLPPPPKPTDREREREAQLHNPMSVYNWLAKHRHELAVDAKDEESHINNNTHSSSSGSGKEKIARGSEKKKKESPKPAPAAPSRGSKRERGSAAGRDVKAELAEEVLDDEGFVIGLRGGGDGTPSGAGGKGKRKRGGEDEAYRPKGGSSRPNKRKRASTIKRGEKEDIGGTEG